MAAMKNSSDILRGVDCDAIHCKYQGHANQCFADSITVESQNAVRKAETFCGTFVPNPEMTAT